MLPSVIDSCEPRQEILAGELSLELFAAKLQLVVEGKAPQVYQDANLFFKNTFPTNGIKNLIKDVFGRLTGRIAGSPIIRLETSFGGGKTHDEIAVWHICKRSRDIVGLDRFVDDLSLIPDHEIQVAAVDGKDLDPLNGIEHSDTGITTYTLWGEIAYQVGHIDGYKLLKGSDQSGIAPGTGVLKNLIGDEPTVIILDEIAQHLRVAKAKKVGDNNLAGQVVAFLFTLMDLAAACDNLVLVYSLASSKDTFAGETEELQRDLQAKDWDVSEELKELRVASARQERILSPSSDIDIFNIVKQRLFETVNSQAAEEVARSYVSSYRASRGVSLPDACQDTSYNHTIIDSYPFHPELFSLLTKKLDAIPQFQKTRGALRLLARLVRYIWQNTDDSNKYWIPMIHVHHLPMGVDQGITDDLTSRLDRQALCAAIGADIYNSNGREAYAQVQDQQWLEAGKPPFASWVARTIFLHSLNQGTAAGIKRAELNLSLLTPKIDIGFVDNVLEQLGRVAWYLDDDPMTTICRFKEEPSINKIITEEKELVTTTEAKNDLRDRRDSIFAKKLFNFCVPEGPADVDDQADNIVLCVLDFDELTIQSSQESAPELLLRIFENTGESGKFRIYKNRLLFLVANQDELNKSVNIAKEYRAIKNILKNQNRLSDLSEPQQKQLKERSGRKDLDVRVALTNAYRHLFYPDYDLTKAPKGLKHHILATQDSSSVKNNHQELILKALQECQKIKTEAESQNPYAPAFILQKVWPSGLDSLTTKGLRDEFFKNINLKMLLDAEVSLLRETIKRGVAEGEWDLKIGKQIFMKVDGQKSANLPDQVEFSERMELYRRGILKLPEPKVIEFNCMPMPTNSDAIKPVDLRWKARGASQVFLYQNDILVPNNFLFSDTYSTEITENTIFKLVAEYEDGEKAEKLVTVDMSPVNIPQANMSVKNGGAVYQADPLLFETYQNPKFNEYGSPNKMMTLFDDFCSDRSVKGMKSLTITVTEVMDYRKLSTTLNLLSRFNFTIKQKVTIQLPEQFMQFEYKGPEKGFKTFLGPINSMLQVSDIRADVELSLIFEFVPEISPQGAEWKDLKQALGRNPVEKLNLAVEVSY